MIHEVSSNLIKTLVSILRSTQTDALRFRHTVGEITKHLLNSVLDEEVLLNTPVQTWQGEEVFEMISQERLMVVSVLRAAMPMQESVMQTLPDIEAGFLAMKRDERTHKSKLYYDRLGDCHGKHVLIVDVMLATGGSLIDAIEVVKGKGAKKISSLNIIGSPEGLEEVQSRYPEVNIHIAQIDEKLNENKYIIPGLGDAGDREYNTPE